MRLRLLLLLPLVALASAAETAPTLRAGAARADITPETSVLNWVSGKPYGTVLDPLFVQALVLEQEGTKAVILRYDLTGISESLREEVRKAVGAALALPGENVMLNASHSHSAPWSPIYADSLRGRERDNWWAIRFMPAQNNHPPFKRWMDRLIAASVEAAKQALASARPATVNLGRVAVGEYLYNRRPRAPAWGLAGGKAPPAIPASHPDWNAEILQGGASFGPMDRTLAIVSFRGADNKTIASLYHVALHAVSIYPSNPAISADWPGAASRAIASVLGGEALFLQGCAGDITPWKRGEAANATLAGGLATKAQLAMRQSAALTTTPLLAGRAIVDLPLTPAGKERTGLDVLETEIQVITCGPLAFVALPGEPLTDVGTAIREKSPFPQTLVLGYSNGDGIHYVGMPGEKARGGYEMGVAGAGTDAAGGLIVDTALRVLRSLHDKVPKK
ncbi:MAG: neutral/alkaline non-lysosomal ceramidase N-terminal domain-containing protein [Opitutaceae bacterium]|nr:neutral/alkaline non-lysosomal ceramidase N-terminal domain-containing protein [Opitutaceae bacterium]